MNSRTTETTYFLKIMGLLASAKVRNDVEGIADCIADLEAIAMWSDGPAVAKRASVEAERASALLADLQAKRFGYAGPVVVMTRADFPANLN